MVRKFMSKFSRYVKLSGASGILRRYFVMNSFDGVLIILGVIVGSYVYGALDARYVVGVGVSASMAMAISGFTGAYVTERAERRRGLLNLEKAMLKSLDNSIHADASRMAKFWAAIVAGISPLLMAFISLSPFFASFYNLIPFQTALYLSLLLICFILFILGMFLGRVSKESVFLSGFKMLVIGLATAFIISLVGSAMGLGG